MAWLLLELVRDETTEISRLSANHAERFSALPEERYLAMGTNMSFPSFCALRLRHIERASRHTAILYKAFISG